MQHGEARDSGVRLAELIGTLSLAADLGLGQPAEHALRSGFVALGLAERLRLDATDRATTYWVNLLAWIGCTADSYELSRWFGDDIAFRADSYQVDLTGRSELAFLLRHAGVGGSIIDRISTAAALIVGGGKQLGDSMFSHCETTGQLARKLGLGPEVDLTLAYTFARWDGKGLPPDTAGTDIPLPARLLHLADVVVAHHRVGGVERAVAVARNRRGTQFDPDLVDLFCASAHELLDELQPLVWDDLVISDPRLSPRLTTEELDAAFEVLADFADLKSPYFLGHSRGVAELASSAAEAAGRAPSEIDLLRRASLVHDIGRAGIANAIWDKPGALTAAEVERVRLHDYYTERMLQHPAALAEIGAVAAAGHERLDGSGYPRRTSSVGTHPLAAFLGAADAYHAMGEPRPHRPALTPAAAVVEMRTDVREGRLDADAVENVLSAAGHTPRRRRVGPAGLTPREVEVLVTLARGASNRQIARALGITPRTAGSHIEHIYTKIGVSTRAAAALFAVQAGLISSYEQPDE